MKQDIRWKQRFSNFGKAFFQLKEGVELYGDTATLKPSLKAVLFSDSKSPTN